MIRMRASRAFALSDRGRVRRDNQDRWVADDAAGVYAVADGVGGVSGGDSVAEVALEAAVKEARRRLESLQSPIAPGTLVEVARDSVWAASDAVRSLARDGGPHPGASTTLTLVLHDGACAAMAHVGDSRLYLSRRKKLEQLSVDHTVANELRRAGVITPEEARLHPLRNVLSRSLGGDRDRLDVDTLLVHLSPGDLLVLASDGLDEALADGKLLDAGDLSQTAQRLVDRADALGGKDNATVVLLHVQDITADPHVRAVEFLSHLVPFEGLDLASRSRVVGAGHIDHLADGDVLVEDGELVYGLCILIEGSAEWTAGGQAEAVRLQPGDAYGVGSLAVPVRSTATAVAVGDCTVFRLPAERWAKLARRRPLVGNSVHRSIAARAVAKLPLELMTRR